MYSFFLHNHNMWKKIKRREKFGGNEILAFQIWKTKFGQVGFGLNRFFGLWWKIA